jgi:hypothetical protein
LGGVQTDANADGTLDAAQNMQILMKQKEMQNKAMQLIDERQSKRQEAIENNLLEREKIAGKLEETRMKTEADKFVAKENKQKHEVKKRK